MLVKVKYAEVSYKFISRRQLAKEHYSYEKKGTCCLLAAIEPLAGKRITDAYEYRTKKEYTEFMQGLAKQYPKAKKIHPVQDNLNSHHLSSFYEYLPADEARALADRFVFYYTSKSASWTNRIEIVFSALSKQCLNRRIATKEMLEQQIKAILKERNEQQIKINWQLSIIKARTTLNKPYTATNPDNIEFKQT
jgi:hypothetical protein